MYVSPLWVRRQRQEAIQVVADKGENGHQFLPSGLVCRGGILESISPLLDLSRPHDFLWPIGH